MHTTLTPIKPPEKAGVARIELGPVGDTPTRRDDVITLPEDAADLRYFPLMDGDQFLVVIGEERAQHTFFGGTDETPFLVELDRFHWFQLEEEGEAGFYDSLKPKNIKQLEERLGTDRTGRQGDIWFYDLGLDWATVGRNHMEITGKHFATSSRPTWLFRTRHRLEGGKLVGHNTLLATPTGPMSTRKESVGSGTLTAPDHAPVTLDRPHVFGRTPGIRPQRWVGNGRLGD